ncbi:MAG: Fe-S cluster assembly ATPase SufC [Myxococcota bacterium]|nr:Fe-S cluster assembly ATPase SufC [Myxococcota bacterium]
MTTLLDIKGLHVAIEGQAILKGLDLTIGAGEVHAIMGPNGSGKSTLAHVLAGRPEYEITAGSIEYRGQDLVELEPEERSREGLFLAFQYPVAIPGVANLYFLKEALNAHREHRGEPALDAPAFMKRVRQEMTKVGMRQDLLKRDLNEGFSGGEKKRNEIFQMLMLEPVLAVLDETDSGLDIDALQTVAKGVNAMRNEQRSFVVVTHYQRLLDHIVPDHVHVLADGRIIHSGDQSLAHKLEAEGYGWLEEVA